MSIFQGGSCKRDEECLIYKDVNLHRQEVSVLVEDLMTFLVLN